jgi:hypothetical protein
MISNSANLVPGGSASTWLTPHGRGLAGTFDHGEREQTGSERALNGACQASRLGNRRDDAISKPVEKPQKADCLRKTSQAAGRL